MGGGFIVDYFLLHVNLLNCTPCPHCPYNSCAISEKEKKNYPQQVREYKSVKITERLGQDGRLSTSAFLSYLKFP